MKTSEKSRDLLKRESCKILLGKVSFIPLYEGCLQLIEP